jgi:hypothetical protein
MDLGNVPGSVLSLLKPYLLQGGDALADDATRLEYGDLEISLHRRAGSAYSVETRFTPPGSTSEIRLGANAPIEIDIDEEALSHLFAPLDWTGYGRALSAALFEPEPVKMAFGQALASAQTSGGVLRLRLLIGPSAPELHALPWETLRHPQTGGLLCTDENILFSRYLSSLDWRPVQLRPKGLLSALVVVANPSNLSDFQNLASLDVEGEIQRAKDGLGEIAITTLPAPTSQGKAETRATLQNLIASVRATAPDILYLVCHGALSRGDPLLWLVDNDGKAAVTSGSEVVTQLRELSQRPMLVVLASCQSAGHPTHGEALSALGPQLAEAGIPAVIAMQANISLQTIAEFMPVFFSELQKDGQIDRALAVARGAVRQRPDFWMPALFMRLKDGSMWQRSGETAPPHLKKLWSLILNRFQGKPAAEGAAQDLLADADDPDNQEAFNIQLKKSLRDDPNFARGLIAIIEASQENGGNGNPGGVVITVGGNVGGSIVLGNNNTIGNITNPG